MLHIFPTSRAIRSFHASYTKNSLLPQAITMADFEAKSTYVPNRIKADEDTRVLLMRQSCNQDIFNSLHIPKNFLAFLNNSNYLFRFFEELSLEGKSCDDLRGCDVYGEFEEHLAILETLEQTYIEQLEQNGLYDTITFPKLYKLNTHFLQNFKQINLYIDGYLNSFEWELFCKITQYCKITIHITTNEYNQKMISLFHSFGIKLPSKKECIVNLNEKTFTCKEVSKSVATVKVKSFSIRSLQIGYVFWQIQNMVENGIAPEKIALILPDENFIHLLKSYDRANNLNFAMGFPFGQTLFMQKLQSIIKAIEDPSLATTFELDRFKLEDIVAIWKTKYKTVILFEEFKKMLYEVEALKKDEKRVLEEELYGLEKLSFTIKLRFQDLLKLLMNRLNNRSCDDVRGGKVTVLGVLETRGAKYDGIIIVDFNENFVPRPSLKDMFLSTNVRYHAKLPTKYDRENLQRYYYYQIINKAKQVAISYTKNEENLPSRFLNSLNFQEDDEYSEQSYATLLLKPYSLKNFFTCKELILKNDILSYPLSASRLKTYLQCPRTYYFKYILKIKDEELPSVRLSALDVGNALHSSLFELYKSEHNFKDIKSLHVKLCDLLDKRYILSPLWELEREVWKNKLWLFCENEIQRFAKGWRPYKLEEKFETIYNGVQLEGKIDRIDKNEDGNLAIIDYKSGKIPFVIEKNIEQMSDFQMQFYQLLVQDLGTIQSCSFYDLNLGNMVEESFMERKIEQLKRVLDELKQQKNINFAPNEKISKYTPYPILCGKEDLV